MSRPDLLARLALASEERARNGLLRRMRTITAIDGAHVVIDGRRLRNFASNDYLGLAAHPLVREAMTRAAARWGVGATAAHLLGGHRDEHEQLEHELAQWTGRSDALLFSSGYMANLGVMQTVLEPRAICVQDKLNHVCLLDGAHLSGARLKRYRHLDVDSARRQLEGDAELPALIASDGVFSMDGDIAPLRELSDLAAQQHASLMIDDAHGIGVLGADGAGSLREAGLDEQQVPILMATLGKALGVCAAFVAGPKALVDGLRQFARTQIYTTAMPPALAAAIRAALRLARDDHERRARLHARVAQFRAGAEQLGLTLIASRTPIQPLLVGDSKLALALSQELEAAGFFVPAIRPPTVPADSARLRITLSASHEEADVAALLDALAGITRKLRIYHPGMASQ